MSGRFVDNERARQAIVQRKAEFLDRFFGRSPDPVLSALLKDIDPEMYNELTQIYPPYRATGTR